VTWCWKSQAYPRAGSTRGGWPAAAAARAAEIGPRGVALDGVSCDADWIATLHAVLDQLCATHGQHWLSVP